MVIVNWALANRRFGMQPRPCQMGVKSHQKSGEMELRGGEREREKGEEIHRSDLTMMSE